MVRSLIAFFAAAVMVLASPAMADTIEQHGGILIIPTSSVMLLQVDTSFRPLYALQFPIAKSTTVDRRVFVESEGPSNIRRVVIIHFESVIPGADFKFVYPATPPADYGDHVYRFGAYVYDDEQAAYKSPAGEAGRTRALLLSRGYKVPRLMRTARLARVSDPMGLSEIIIFYMENADADHPAGPLAGADEDGDLALDDVGKKAILERLKSTVHLITG